VLASVLDPLYQLMAAILAAIYSVIPNYAVAILGLTLVVLALLTPLTLKGLRSTIKIQKLMPEQKRLQAQFKDDRQALNAAIMAMYKENKVSPVGGCLPFLVQSPFFIALFGVLRGMSRVKYWVPTDRAVFVQGQATGKANGKVPEGAVPVGLPKHLPQGSSLYKSLFGTSDPRGVRPNLPLVKHAPGEVKAFGFDLARSAAEMSTKGFVKFLPYLVLIVLMIGLQVFAQRQVNQRNPAAAAANPQMQTVTKVMPFMFGIFGWGFQAGLTLYWTTSSGLRILQQWALYRFDPTLAESVRQKRADLAREAATGKRPDKPAKRRPDRLGKRRDGSKRAEKPGTNDTKPVASTRAKAQKAKRPGNAGGTAPKRPDKAGGTGPARPSGGSKGGKSSSAKATPTGQGTTPTKPGGTPASKPTLADPKAAGDGLRGSSNGSAAGPPRPNPGRQQPKKRRKGR